MYWTVAMYIAVYFSCGIYMSAKVFSLTVRRVFDNLSVFVVQVVRLWHAYMWLPITTTIIGVGCGIVSSSVSGTLSSITRSD